MFFTAALLLTLAFPSYVLAKGNSTYETFSSVPEAQEIERQKQYILTPGNAWEVDLQGNVKPALYIVPNTRDYNEIAPLSWSDGTYDYVFFGYISTSTKKDPKRFFISKITVENNNRASCMKYRAGGYGAGQAAWKKYMKGTSSWVGMYYTDESG